MPWIMNGENRTELKALRASQSFFSSHIPDYQKAFAQESRGTIAIH